MKAANQSRYYQTTPLTDEQLIGAFILAECQDEMVMAIFRHRRRPMTPRQVWGICNDAGKDWELTSIRRSMTNLAKDGALVHWPDHARMGPKGRPETLWALPGHQAARPLPKAKAA